MAVTRYGDPGVSPRTNVYAAMKMLETTVPVVLLDKFGEVKPMPRNKTQRIRFRRPRVFEAVSTPLVEGVTPVATQFRFEDVEGTLRQYGMVVTVTDHITDTHEDQVVMAASKQAGLNIARTFEGLRWGVLRAGTSVLFANGTQRSQVNTIINRQKVRLAVRTLRAQKAMPITEILAPSINIDTTPVEAAYIAITHTDMDADIRAMDNFIDISRYGTRRPVHDCELGKVENVRFCTSPDLPPYLGAGASGGTNVLETGGNADVYPILFLGQHAYGTVPLRGQDAVEPGIIPTGLRTKSDPLGQLGYVGWKSWFLCLILNETWMMRGETACASL